MLLDVALQTVNRHMHATSRLHEVRKTSAKLRSKTTFPTRRTAATPEWMSLPTNLGPDAVSSNLHSLSTCRRRVHDSGPTEHRMSLADRARYSAGRQPRKRSHW